MLRTDFTGVQIEGQVGYPERTSQTESTVNLLVGTESPGRVFRVDLASETEEPGRLADKLDPSDEPPRLRIV